MSDRPWYKRFPSDFVNGCISGHLTAEEVGVYAIILDMIYDRGPIPNDPRWIGGMVQLSTRRSRQVIQSLIKKGKIQEAGEKLTNKRAEKEAENSAKDARKLSENGVKGAEKTNEKRAELNKNNNIAEKEPENSERQSRSHIPEARDKGPLTPKSKDDLCELPDFLDRRYQGDLTPEQKREKWAHNLKNFMLRKNGGNIELVHKVMDAWDRGEQWAKTQVDEIDQQMRAGG